MKLPYIIAIALLIFALGFSIGYFNRKTTIQTVTQIDSTEVVTLRNRIALLTNQLNAKPTTVFIPISGQNTGQNWPDSPVVDTVKVYPIGSYTNDYTVPFKTDELKLNTLINTYTYAYIDPVSGSYFHSDSVSVQLRDIVITHPKVPMPTIKRRYLDVIAGAVVNAGYDTDTQHLKFNTGGVEIGLRLMDRLDLAVQGNSDLTMGVRVGWRL